VEDLRLNAKRRKIMNLIKWIVLSALGITKDVGDWATTYVEATGKLVRLIFGITLIPGIIGIIVGYAGAETVGQTIITATGAVAALLLSFFYFRAVIITEALAGLSYVAKSVTDKAPEFTKKQADDFLAWLRGYTAWAMIIALYGSLVPLYKHPTTTMIIVIAVAALAAIMGANWTKTDSFQKWASRGTIVVLAVCTVFLAFPRFTENVRNQADSKLSFVFSWNEEDVKIDEQMLVIEKQEASTNLSILQKLRDDKALLEQRIVTCGGDFCNDQEKAKYVETLKLIEEAESGDYLKRRAGVKSPSLWSKVSSLGSPNNNSTSANTATASPPPPPSQPATPTVNGNVASTPPPSGIQPKRSSRRSKRGVKSYLQILSDLEADLQ
jgi:hypothetical protein